jgi:hypothetical protein
MADAALIDSNIPDLRLLSKGKVRDIYSTSSTDHLLFVASDRISAYDVILKNVNHPSPLPILFIASFNVPTYTYFYLTTTTIVLPVPRAFRTRAAS